MTTSAGRAARNEALFREVNERAKQVVDAFETRTMSAFCECSRSTCTETVAVPVEAYEAVRSRGERFLLVEGHDDPSIERVVERHERFIVVEKIGEGAVVARELDPRSRPASRPPRRP